MKAKQVLNMFLDSQPTQNDSQDTYNFTNSRARPPSNPSLHEHPPARVDDLLRELAAKQKQLQGVQRNYESISKLCKGEKQRNSQLQAEMEELQKTNREILGRQLEKEKNDSDGLQKKVASLESSLQGKESQIEQLQGRVGTLKEQLKGLDGLRLTNNQLEAKMGQLKQQMAKQQQQTSSPQVDPAQQAQLESLRQRIEALQKELRLSHLETGKCQQEMIQLVEEKNKHKAERQALKQKLMEYSKQEQKQLDEIQEYRQRLKALEEAVQQQDIGKLKQQLQAQQNNQQLQKQLDQRENRLTAYARYDSVIESIETKGIGLEDVYVCSRGKIEQLKAQVQDIKEQLDHSHLAMQQQKQQNSLLVQQQALDQQERQQLQSQLDKARQEQKRISDDNQQMEQQIRRFKNNDNREQLYDEIKQLKKINGTLQEQQEIYEESLERQKKQAGAMSRDHKETQEIIRKQEIQIQELKDKIAKREGDLQESRREKDNMQADHDNQQTHLQELQGILAQRQREHSTLMAETHTLQNEKRELEDKVAKLQKGEREGQSLQSQVDSLEKQKQKLEQEIDEINRVHKQKLEGKDKELVEIKAENQIKGEEVYQLRRQLKVSQQKQERAEEEQKEINARKLKEVLGQIASREKGIKGVVTQLEQAYDSLVANLACLHCLELMKHPITNYPCGHSYCQDCPQGYSTQCEECHAPSNTYPNAQLQEVLSKFTFIELTLSALKRPPLDDQSLLS